MSNIGHSIGILSSSKCFFDINSQISTKIYFFKKNDIKTKNRIIFLSNNLEIPKFGMPQKLPDLIHFHGLYNMFNVKYARKCLKAGIPYIVTLHGNLIKEARNYHKFRKAIAIKLLFLRYLREASALHALSKTEAKDILDIVPEAKVVIIPNGISSNYLNFMNSARYITAKNDSNKFTFLFLGRLDINHKGLDLLLNAINIIGQELRNKNARILLTGPFNSRRDKIKIMNFISHYCINDIVDITGPKYGKDKINIIISSDIFIHTSRYEGMPIAVLEAMSFGKPCIITPGTNLGDYMRKANAGWITKPDSMSIAETIIKAIQTPYSKIKEKGNNARALVKDKYLLSKTVNSMISLYSSIIEK